MSINWNGKYAKDFVILFEMYGSNERRFERKFRNAHEKQFGRSYTQAYKTAKVAYQRHATIHRFLNYKQKNLHELTDDFKYFAVWLMNREHISNIQTSMGYYGTLDENNEPISDDETQEESTDYVYNDKRRKNHPVLRTNKKRKLNSTRKEYITTFEDDTDDDMDIITVNNNNNNNDNNNNSSRKLKKKRTNDSGNNNVIKGVNSVKDAIKELSNISPLLGDLVQASISKGLVSVNGQNNKKKNNNLMYETLVKLQQQTKKNKQQMTIDNMKDVMNSLIDVLVPPNVDLMNLLIGCGFNKINVFCLWLSHQYIDILQTVPTETLINNIGILYKKNKIGEFIDMWLLIKASTNDDGDDVLKYLNEHFKSIKGWINLNTADTIDNIVNNNDMNIDEDNELPPNINILSNNDDNNNDIPYDKREMDA